ncbi:hypothetical protein IMCC3317_05120 [Kordia antarctica]|uniref:Lipoprotein n=1 Tax=Kordia antarctica TaxID=1218801 RepID=A0A7L4ZG29_9FLAO|nr:hypothetical protein [Kordia antarctica]QHI35166.1 hypothetical protein IMCC3317_05120 [Kordia antarctica]
MQKVKIVKRISFFVLILLITISCENNKQSDDQQLLELVLKQKQSQFSKPIYLNPNGDNNSLKDFFRFRNSENETFRFANLKDSNTEIANDSLYIKYDTIIYEKQKIISNNYIMNGKGIDENVETFLKDSFNYKKERIVKWVVPKSLKNIVNKNKDTKDYLIKVSAPIYNLDKNKAILMTFHRSSKNMAQQNIYFIERKTENWNIIYSEESDMFLDLRIE